MPKRKRMQPKRPRVVLVNRCFVMRNDGMLLIIKRSPTDTNNPGKWEPPGGKVDEGQDMTDAQEREVLEETGLLAQVTHRVATTVHFIIGNGHYKGLLYLALFSITRVVGGNFKLSDEHTHQAWVGYGKMLEYDLTHEVRKAAIVLKGYLA